MPTPGSLQFRAETTASHLQSARKLFLLIFALHLTLCTAIAMCYWCDWGIIWGMSGVLSGTSSEACLGIIWARLGHVWSMSRTCLGHYLGNVRGMSRASSGASSGACLGHHLGHVSDNIWGILSTMDNNLQSVMPFYCSRFSDKLHSPLPSQCSKLALPTCEPRGH